MRKIQYKFRELEFIDYKQAKEGDYIFACEGLVRPILDEKIIKKSIKHSPGVDWVFDKLEDFKIDEDGFISWKAVEESGETDKVHCSYSIKGKDYFIMTEIQAKAFCLKYNLELPI